MTGTKRTTTIGGKVYTFWADFARRATIAESEDGDQRAISGQGYIHNDLTVRKAIAAAYGLPTFRR